jgi:hypothetical protein
MSNYRYLREGDIVQEDDEYVSPRHNAWMPVGACIGKVVRDFEEEDKMLRRPYPETIDKIIEKLYDLPQHNLDDILRRVELCYED